ncbi:hypothetical protein V6N13_119226 [Hibiscus sabdariffa]|uniref:C2H2-type domain-containing protein n=1 Tax=Hibiscus sabdariffa TaxID=183260 RepID=A0ABR2E1U8_9ROSI
MCDSDHAAASFVFAAPPYLKTIHKTQVMDRGDEALQDSRMNVCSYCRKGFVSSKALCGHLRIHSQARSKTGILHINNPKPETKRSPEQDEGFCCFVCNQSFSSARLLCQHKRIHRRTASNGVRQPTCMSLENGSLSETKTAVKQGFGSNDHNIYLLKDMPGLSQTRKRGLQGNDDIIYDAMPLRVYYEPADPHMEASKKKKIEETMSTYQDTSMAGVADTDSESTVEQLGNCMAIDWFPTHDSNNPKSMSWRGRRSMKKAEAVKSIHQCEICGKTFATGQALGGHKTAHREKDPLEVKLVRANTKQEPCGEVKEYVTRMLFPEEVHMPEQTHPKKMLDFDLNVPYQE